MLAKWQAARAAVLRFDALRIELKRWHCIPFLLHVAIEQVDLPGGRDVYRVGKLVPTMPRDQRVGVAGGAVG
jgi:hypothetical protein